MKIILDSCPAGLALICKSQHWRGEESLLVAPACSYNFQKLTALSGVKKMIRNMSVFVV